MPPATVTQPTLVEKSKHPSQCRECYFSHTLLESNNTGNNNDSIKAKIYDQSRPKHDPSFLQPIRELEKWMGFETALRWINIISISFFHFAVIFGFIYQLAMVGLPKWQTVVFGFLVGQIAGFGVTAGAHRLWCHRSYKAKMPLQIILILCYSAAGQNNLYEWVRDHRVHHKYSETSADPHDSRRGLFFSHVGWLMMKKHPEVIRKGSKMDMTDILNDPLVRFHTKYFYWFKIACCFVLPTLVPFLWNETWQYAVLSQPMLRYMFTVNFTWAVNSFAHIYGHKPYDKHINPAENWIVSLVAIGEGWHNYHHTFPWDYKAAELGYCLNLTTLILDIFAKIGWAYDMKEASPDLVKTVVMKRGERHT